MSKREKNLIFIMLVMAICFGGFKYFLEPAISTSTALNMESTTLVVDMASAKEQLENALATEASYADSVQMMEDLASQMNPYRQDEELETMFLDVAKDNDLSLKTFEMERMESADPEYAEADGDLVLTAVTGKNFTISADGDYVRFTALLENLLQMEDVIVRKASYVQGEEDVTLVVEGTVFMANH